MQKDHQDDRLSELPDHILLKILDQCDVRDAVRTSILSRRWRQLPTTISRLVIDVNHFLPKSVFEPSRDEIVCTNAAVVEAIKSILSRRNSNPYSMTFYI
ncbi:hypothetical protein PR202_ga03356 [Eleusine coracana subsp. coracana]|uniref:F-box domain-containing protein n=1 Tax=Eleusine coracana subsp. coracana TaxID=191504 RepID=A0AAV5BLR3_ELECO|nr:hypothetical protein PR202_ga03356 [Eleusine coracana subsp. coracana]